MDRPGRYLPAGAIGLARVIPSELLQYATGWAVASVAANDRPQFDHASGLRTGRIQHERDRVLHAGSLDDRKPAIGIEVAAG
jgi:hypothetical protein